MTEFTKEYDRYFAASMQTKLRLNRESRAKNLNMLSPIAETAEQYHDLRKRAEQAAFENSERLTLGDLDEFTASIVASAIRRHPSLTIEEVAQMLREFRG